MNPAQVSANEKKSRLSRLLGKRDKTPERPISLPDSAYASSETPSGAEVAKEKEREMEKDRLSSAMVPAEKNSEIANIDKGKNLALKPSTGEVFDQDTGEVVTVVTTTTTTTTTTTRKPGQGPPEVNNDVRREIRETQQVPPVITSAASSGGMSGMSEMPANTVSVAQSPVQSAITAPSQSGGLSPSHAQTTQSPPIPTKSPNRRSMEVIPDAAIGTTNQDYVPGSYRPSSPPGSPSRHNFSYPSRAAPGVGTTQSGLTLTDSASTQNRGTTIADLKAAAKGIHGVGETLRGTLNSTIDRRFPSRDAEKAAQINARNDGVLAKGRTEIDGIPHHRINDVREANPPGAWPEHAPETGPQSISAATTMPDNRETSTLRSDSREKEKARSISKLFKRKPLAGEKEELRVTNP